MISVEMSGREQVGGLIRQWGTEGCAEAKAEWAGCPEGLSRPEAIDVLQKRIRAQERLLIWQEASSRTLTGWEADYADWYWQRIEEAQRWARAEIRERRRMIGALRDLK